MRKIAPMVAALLLAAEVAQAQILLMEEELSERAGSESYDLPNIPQLGVTYDQLAPLGGDMLLLGCLGGAYLLGKRRKKRTE